MGQGKVTGTASITKSVSESAESSVEVVMRALICSATSPVMRCLAISLSSSNSITAAYQSICLMGFLLVYSWVWKILLMNLSELSIDAWELSTIVTGTPATFAATRAIPRPWKSIRFVYPRHIPQVQCIEGKIPSVQHR